MRAGVALLTLATAAAWSHAPAAQMTVKYALASQVVLADPTPTPFLQGGDDLARAFRAKFSAAFPGQVLDLETPDQMISPNDRVLVIVPTITVARLADEVKAGSIHSFDAVIVGDVSALDPWTDANLYSGTRMVTSSFEIGESALGRLEPKAREAFANSADKWLDAAIGQMKVNLAPFVLEAATLAPPAKAKAFKGGVWPFGSQRGVKVGRALNGGPGRYAKVSAVYPKFSLIEDVADPSRILPAGERYSLTVVDKPTQRPEPSVSLTWLGAAPTSPEGLAVSVLAPDAFVGLFDNYLSKAGGIKILPPRLSNKSAKAQLAKIAQEISSRSKLVAGSLGTFERENLVLRAAESPDRLLEIGVLEQYHGTRAKPDGSTEHYYRLTLAAAARERSGSEETPVYPLSAVVEHSEEIAQVEQKGIRDIDPSDTYFTLCRNAVINLAKKTRDGMGSSAASGESREALVGNGAIDWKGAQPTAFTPLTWLRPCGEVAGADGAPLGTLFQYMTPSQGYLNASVVAKEKFEAGDVLRYSTGTAAGRPLVALRAEDVQGAPPWCPEKRWLLRLAARSLAPAADALVVPLDEGGGPLQGTQWLMNLKVSALGADMAAGTPTFTGQWRYQVLSKDPDPAAPPLLKFGIQSDAPLSLQNPGGRLDPPDLRGWGLQYIVDALKKVAETGTGKGLKQTLSNTN